MKTPLILGLLIAAPSLFAADSSPSPSVSPTPAAPPPTVAAVKAVNALGIDLLSKTSSGSNALLSPYSIQSALAMTYVGADGETKSQMMKALHYPKDPAALATSFAALHDALLHLEIGNEPVTDGKKSPGPVTINVANRLFGSESTNFRDTFLKTLQDAFNAPLTKLDFTHAAHSADTINTWVADQTNNRIKNLIPLSALNKDTRLVLVNALYFKAPWESAFDKSATAPASFHGDGGPYDVPTMFKRYGFGYSKKEAYTALTLSYLGGDLQLLIILPSDPDGLGAIESRLTPAALAECVNLPHRDIKLWLPKFKLEPAAIDLSAQLDSLGMPSAFNHPPGSANFVLMATGDSLFISNVFHKTFLSLDEQGTEAAAATATAMAGMAIMQRPEPLEVHVDHPFIFAIQQRSTGACLFIGRVTDPRATAQ